MTFSIGHWPPRQIMPPRASAPGPIGQMNDPRPRIRAAPAAQGQHPAVAATVKKTAAGNSQSPGARGVGVQPNNPIRAATIAAATAKRQRSIVPVVLVAAGSQEGYVLQTGSQFQVGGREGIRD